MKRAPGMICVVILLFAVACTSRKKEEELNKRKSELDQREQKLLLKERTLQLEGERLQKLQARNDSIRNDSNTFKTRFNIEGNWLVKMTCIETTCPGSAVGDVKTEEWAFTYQNDHIIARASTRDRLVRVYSGLATENGLELIEHKDSGSLTYDTRMVVRLRIKDERNIEGLREIIREKDCKILYSMKMDKL